MQRFDDRLSLLLYVTRQIRYWIYLESRHFSSSDSLYFVLHCVYIACSEYLFFHQSRHCQDDKLVCQIISGTKFGFVKNIHVMEKSNNCADIPKMKQLSSKTTFHLIDMWQWHCGDMAPAAAGYCSCCPPVSGSQSEARVECPWPMRGRGYAVMWRPSVVISLTQTLPWVTTVRSVPCVTSHNTCPGCLIWAQQVTFFTCHIYFVTLFSFLPLM